MSSRSIDVYLITGFLGSGKTTFLRNILDHTNFSPQVKCGILMNEFGAENVDSELFPQNNISITELNGGSIFCSCLHSQFIEALKTFYEATKVNTLFIETSGLSNPSMIFQDLEIINSQIGNVYKIKETICLVDASLVIKLMDVITSISTQIQVSSCVLVNKTDLVDLSQLNSVEELIYEINPNANIFKTQFGKINLKKLRSLDKGQIQRNIDGIRDTKGDHSSITLIQTKQISKEMLLDFIGSLNDLILRMKGYIDLLEEGWYRIDQVERNLNLKPVVSKPDHGSLIVIFREIIDVHKIETQWKLLG